MGCVLSLNCLVSFEIPWPVFNPTDRGVSVLHRTFRYRALPHFNWKRRKSAFNMDTVSLGWEGFASFDKRVARSGHPSLCRHVLLA